VVQLPPQQGRPTGPQVPQAPITQTAPLLQSCPSGTQVPGSAGLAREQQPSVHRLSEQQGSPRPPHLTHIGPAASTTQTAPSPHADPAISAGQQGVPIWPQPLHPPPVHVP
jgi:hypothetical protein